MYSTINKQYSYLLGIEAFLCGGDLKDNPFHLIKEFDNRASWAQGWFDTAWNIDPKTALNEVRTYYGI